MKHCYWFMLSFILIAMISAFFASCDSDEDQSFSNDDIVGLWEIVHEEGWEISDGEKSTWSMDFSDDAERFNADGAGRVEFRADGTGVTYRYFRGHWDESQYDKFTYTLSGNKLAIHNLYDDENSNLKIVSLNQNALVLLYAWNEGGEKGERSDTYNRVK